MPTHSDWRKITPDVAGSVLGKRRFKKARKGNALPVRARTPRKKNSQRGPTVGRVRNTRPARPPQPITARVRAAGRTDLTDGEVDSNSLCSQYSQKLGVIVAPDSITKDIIAASE